MGGSHFIGIVYLLIFFYFVIVLLLFCFVFYYCYFVLFLYGLYRVSFKDLYVKGHYGLGLNVLGDMCVRGFRC